MWDLQFRIWFKIVQYLEEDVYIGTTYINKCIRDIFLMKQLLVPERLEPVSILEEMLRPT